VGHLLTNGSDWRVYHLTAGLPVVIDLALSVDLLDDTTPLAKKAESLFFLTRESFKRNQIDELCGEPGRQHRRASLRALWCPIPLWTPFARKSDELRGTTRRRRIWSAFSRRL